MSCHHPYNAFWTGSYTESGKKEYLLVMNNDAGIVSAALAEKRGCHIAPGAPVMLYEGKVYLTDPMKVPCGTCLGCRLDRAREWKDRLCIEAKNWKYCYFITLTYQHAPSCLQKRDLQLFFKRLRKSGFSFKYFACGEYGELNGRPHYHAILFSDQVLELVPCAKNVFKCPPVDKAWLLGITEVSFADPACFAYVAGYVMKKQKKERKDEFIVMSRRPGIGQVDTPLEELMKHPRIYAYFGNKQTSTRLFRYYRKKIAEIDDGSFQASRIELGQNVLDGERLARGALDENHLGFMKDEELQHNLKDKRIEKL